MDENEEKFLQLAATGDQLYGLRKEGDVWQYDRTRALWKRLPMTVEQPLGRPIGGKHG